MKESQLETFYSFLRFPSISTDDEYRDPLIACAGWLVQKMKSIGFDANLISTNGHPVVWGHTASDPNNENFPVANLEKGTRLNQVFLQQLA